MLIVFLLFLVFFLVKKDLTVQRQLQDRLLELASVDELTTLYNGGEINRRFADEVERSRRYGQPLSLLLLDVDHFKSINDEFGHPAGDEVLRSVAYRIRDCVRSVDIAGRFGGEEFAVILPNTDRDAAFVIAERVRQGISREPFELTNESKRDTDSANHNKHRYLVNEKGETDEDAFRTADTACCIKPRVKAVIVTVLFEQFATVQ